ncbi:bacitracin ABC transporter ATP-binding protein [Robertmurraya sp. Marseille-Q9965]
MLKENDPLLSDEFLDELAKEINEQYGWEKPEEPEDEVKE